MFDCLCSISLLELLNSPEVVLELEYDCNQYVLRLPLCPDI
jgi:hypothetical protein